jgi:hypothetical protein
MLHGRIINFVLATLLEQASGVAYGSIRQHTSAYISVCSSLEKAGGVAYVSIRLA